MTREEAQAILDNAVRKIREDGAWQCEVLNHGYTENGLHIKHAIRVWPDKVAMAKLELEKK